MLSLSWGYIQLFVPMLDWRQLNAGTPAAYVGTLLDLILACLMLFSSLYRQKKWFLPCSLVMRMVWTEPKLGQNQLQTLVWAQNKSLCGPVKFPKPFASFAHQPLETPAINPTMAQSKHRFNLGLALAEHNKHTHVLSAVLLAVLLLILRTTWNGSFVSSIKRSWKIYVDVMLMWRGSLCSGHMGVS